MMIERLDRIITNDGVCRRHCVSALTMLGQHGQDSRHRATLKIAEAIAGFGATGQ